MSIEWALWLMKATIARIETMPSTTATATDRFGMTGEPSCSSGAPHRSQHDEAVGEGADDHAHDPLVERDRGTDRGSTRGEYWLDACWISSSDTEKAMPAKVIVAPATVLSTARALSTVDVIPRGGRCRRRRIACRRDAPDAEADADDHERHRDEEQAAAEVARRALRARTTIERSVAHRPPGPRARWQAVVGVQGGDQGGRDDDVRHRGAGRGPQPAVPRARHRRPGRGHAGERAHIGPWFGTVKIGLELYATAGPEAVAAMQELGLDVFVDLKLHDIPTTVHKTARVLGSLGVELPDVPRPRRGRHAPRRASRARSKGPRRPA